MCIGIPMQVVELHDESASCVYRGQESMIDMMLVGPQPVGTWLQVFLGTAREVLSEQKAKQITDALDAMRLAMQGDNRIDHFFSDLIDREPQLPDFLKS